MKQTIEPTEEPLALRALRILPSFRGKSRVARTLLSAAQKNRCTLIRDRYGNRIAVPNLVEPVGFSLGLDGSYEPEIVDFLRTLVDKECDFVDAGANIGAFTLALAGSARRVFAIEASPAVLPFLHRNVGTNGHHNVTVVPRALSAPGIDEVPFFVPPMDHFGMGSSAGQFDVAPISIAAATLDSILSEFKAGRIGALKVDVEGFEAHVFLGAAQLLRSPDAPIVVFEFCDWAEERAFPGRKGWAQQIMLDAGYQLWRFPDYMRKAAPLGKPMAVGSEMIVACKS